MSPHGWQITSRRDMRTGTYFALNVQALGREGTSVVTVKARALPGPAYVCLTCLKNECAHTEFVASQDTVDMPDSGESAA
jgi:hypothetical protein